MADHLKRYYPRRTGSLVALLAGLSNAVMSTSHLGVGNEYTAARGCAVPQTPAKLGPNDRFSHTTRLPYSSNASTSSAVVVLYG
jgi:hypothetical protein